MPLNSRVYQPYIEKLVMKNLGSIDRKKCMAPSEMFTALEAAANAITGDETAVKGAIRDALKAILVPGKDMVDA